MNIAAFIDCENIHREYADQIFDELAKKGDLIYCNGYGDFANPYHLNWRDPLMRHGVRSVQVFHNTKDGADSEILIDATECAITDKKIDAIVIVSNDGIYHTLKRILHKYDKKFYVIGTSFANQVLIDSSDSFERIEKAGFDEGPKEALISIVARNSGKMRLAELGNEARGLIPDYRSIGFRNLSDYVASLGGFLISEDNGFFPPVSWVELLATEGAHS